MDSLHQSSSDTFNPSDPLSKLLDPLDPGSAPEKKEDIYLQVQHFNRTIDQLVSEERSTSKDHGGYSASRIGDVGRKVSDPPTSALPDLTLPDLTLPDLTLPDISPLDGITSPPPQIAETASVTSTKIRNEVKEEIGGIRHKLQSVVQATFRQEIYSLPDIIDRKSFQHSSSLRRFKATGLETLVTTLEPSLNQGPGVVLARLQVALLSLILDDLKSLFVEIISMIRHNAPAGQWRKELKKRLKTALRRNFLAFLDSLEEALCIGLARFFVETCSNALSMGKELLVSPLLSKTEDLLRKAIGPIIENIQERLRKKWNLPATNVLKNSSSHS
ncbi:hypothetical protein BJ684DRAFT_17079 [Piptocephalis cylindrospora]|uniref:Uncharacterized protein n=1 Tax=Piptocephalis cylindrospora TaxID=1907219 RepID=A0A4P9Y1M1_9FUNG|nr:hypothetical protein BJ684DRAFT_17079 [Piptocephalis cylindrospora]|eukprot:RKP12432.1 hypothetical protein BJ684DRAFT_17079 [Piptocephalis cylindrospora]